jgi:hypothetical protein
VDEHNNNPLAQEENILSVRLSLAYRYIQVLGVAYDAHLYHAINYRDLPEYKDTEWLDEGYKLEPLAGRSLILRWLTRLEHGIEAAIRRKQFKVT